VAMRKHGYFPAVPLPETREYLRGLAGRAKMAHASGDYGQRGSVCAEHDRIVLAALRRKTEL
jgi:hypothetical protein